MYFILLESCVKGISHELQSRKFSETNLVLLALDFLSFLFVTVVGAGTTIDFLRAVTEGNIYAVRHWNQIFEKYNQNWENYNGSKLKKGFNVSIDNIYSYLISSVY